MTFGFATLVDLLSWMVAALLALKVAATLVLLRQDKARWFDTRRGALLWWSTKIVPLLALPCMIAIALLGRRPAEAWTYAALMVFVLIAVPLAIWSRFRRRGGAQRPCERATAARPRTST
jgi:high-affinity Fe2+/Pb2+ permease